MISVNLAVVNFLPIPVLDGGHMVFLILERILGRPVPERVFAFAMYIGLCLILSLMVFVLSWTSAGCSSGSRSEGELKRGPFHFEWSDHSSIFNRSRSMLPPLRTHRVRVQAGRLTFPDTSAATEAAAAGSATTLQALQNEPHRLQDFGVGDEYDLIDPFLNVSQRVLPGERGRQAVGYGVEAIKADRFAALHFRSSPPHRWARRR